jgi:hypothetical protein
MRFLSLAEGRGETAAVIMLSTYSNCNGERAAADGQKVIRVFVFFGREDYEGTNTSIVVILSRFVR